MKELFVFGAGASKASGDTPLGSELVWQYYQDCCIMSPIINGKPDNSEEDKNFANYTKFLKAVSHYYPEFKDEVRKFIDRGIYIYGGPNKLRKEHYVDEFLRRTQEAHDTDMTNLIKQLLFEHLVQSSFGRPNEIYEAFTEEVLCKIPSRDVSVISFNFDFLLREDFYNHVYFDYLMDFDYIDENRKRIYRKQNPIPLMKLNGSLDWGICQNCGSLNLYYPNMGREFYNDKICTKCEFKIEPFIVVPHQKYSDKIRVVWESANKYISSAEKITVIGYSFPTYDVEVAKLFRNSVKPGTEIAVVDFCNEKEIGYTLRNISDKYSRLLPHLENRITIITSGFEGYMSERLGSKISKQIAR